MPRVMAEETTRMRSPGDVTSENSEVRQLRIRGSPLKRFRLAIAGGVIARVLM
jgi:hypothetical protein